MSSSTLQTVLIGIAIALQGWSLSTIVDVKERVAKLEAFQEATARRRTAALERDAHPELAVLRGDVELDR